MIDSLQRPTNLTTGRHDTFRHLHERTRKRDGLRIGNQREVRWEHFIHIRKLHNSNKMLVILDESKA
jgi:hypothetical protein